MWQAMGWRCVLVLLAVLSCQPARAELKAFPEAEGVGSIATGGRNGTIYHVTNLNNSGAGSFRDAVSQPNRYVVFDVGGNIVLTTEVAVKSNITIAGQTAPGGGIQITGREVSLGSQSNIIVRHLRFRPGDTADSNDNGINLYRSNKVVLDHVSIEFAPYNNIDAVDDNHTGSQVTIQNSIVADPIGQQFVAHTESLDGAYTWANNLLVSMHNRGPLAKVDTIFKNNVVYNYSAAYTVSDTSGIFSHDAVNNYFITGPADSGGSKAFYDLNMGQSFYSSGNLRDNNRDGALNGSSVSPTGVVVLSSPWSLMTSQLPTLTAAQAYSYVVANSGASLVRDELDSLVLSQVQTLGNGPTGYTLGTAGPDGGVYHNAASTGLSNGGLGTIAASTRPAGFDTDNDGVPDTWETAHGMNPASASDSLLPGRLGYTMLEEYANELGNPNARVNIWTAASGSWTTPANWNNGTPLGYDVAKIRGNGAGTNGLVSLANVTGTAMQLWIGGNGDPAGEKVVVNNRGLVRVYDTAIIGAENQGTLELNTGGSFLATNVLLGNTVGGNTYQGSIVINGGTLRASQIALGGGTFQNWNTGGQIHWIAGRIAPFGNITVKVPVSLEGSSEAFSNGENMTFSGVLSGSGSILKSGAGKLSFTANNTYTGATTVTGGELRVSGSLQTTLLSVQTGAALEGGGSTTGDVVIAAGATFTPGTSAGTFGIGGNLDLQATSLLQIEVGGPASFDHVNVAGNLSLAGGLDVELLPGFAFADNQSFEFLDVGGAASGEFASLVEGAVIGTFGPVKLYITYASGDGNDIALFTSVAIPGDFNNDGAVDAGDYTMWRDALGQIGTNLAADGNNDGKVDNGDYIVWQSHFGQSGPGSGSSTAVPEPTGAAIWLIAFVCGLVTVRYNRSPIRISCRIVAAAIPFYCVS